MTAETTPAVETDLLDPADFLLIPPASIQPAGENRRFADDEDFRAFVENVRQYGVLVPLLVRSLKTDDPDGASYELIAGERRWSAATELGLEAVPAFILDYNEDADRLAVMWAENYLRRNLTTMDQARHVGHLADLGLSQREIAERLGVSQPQVSKLHALLKLPPKAQEWVDGGELTQAEAVKIASLPPTEIKKLVPATAKAPPRDWEIERSYEAIRRQAANVKGREQAKELGFKVVKDKPWSTTADGNRPVLFPRSSADTWATLAHVDKKAHEKDPCHAVYIEARGDKPVLVPICTNPGAHPRPKGWKPKNADKGAKSSDPWAERRQRKEAAVAAHLPRILALTKQALEVATKREDDEYCIDFAAYAAIDMDQGQGWDAAELLGVPRDESHPHSSEPLVKSLLAPTPGTVDGFSVLYALALASGLQVVEEEIGHLSEGGKRDKWTLPAQEQTKAFLNHLDGLVEDVPKYEDLAAAVQSGKPLAGAEVEEEQEEQEAPSLGQPLPHAKCSVCGGNYALRRNGTMREHRGLGSTDLGAEPAPVCAGSALPPAADEEEDTQPDSEVDKPGPDSESEQVGDGESADTHTVTLKTKGGKVHRTCTCGNRGASTTREMALQVAHQHIERAHGGVGAVQDELVGVG